MRSTHGVMVGHFLSHFEFRGDSPSPIWSECVSSWDINGHSLKPPSQPLGHSHVTSDPRSALSGQTAHLS